MDKVKADKLREVTDGHDGTWIAHPGLLKIAKQVRCTNTLVAASDLSPLVSVHLLSPELSTRPGHA